MVALTKRDKKHENNLWQLSCFFPLSINTNIDSIYTVNGCMKKSERLKSSKFSQDFFYINLSGIGSQSGSQKTRYFTVSIDSHINSIKIT